MMTARKGFTPTESRMLKVLRDGEPHTPAELHACLWDEAGATANIRAHLSNIRKRLRLRGLDILCVIHNRKVHYRQVRVIKRRQT